MNGHIKRKPATFLSRLVVILIMVCALLVTTLSVGPQVNAQGPGAAARKACEQVLEKVAAQFQQMQSCGTLGENQACYANKLVLAEFRPDLTPSQFDAPGQTVGLTVLTSLKTSPLDLIKQEWGVALLKLLTASALPGVSGGVPTLFVAYGDASLQDASFTADVPPRINAFYFAGGIGSPECQDLGDDTVPPGGLLVSNPDGTQVAFQVNGVDIKIGSTILIRAYPNQQMIMAVLEGTLTAQIGGQPPETAIAGQEVWVEVGGPAGLTAQRFIPPAVRNTSFPNMGLSNVCKLATAAGMRVPPMCQNMKVLVPTATPVMPTPELFIPSPIPTETPTPTITPRPRPVYGLLNGGVGLTNGATMNGGRIQVEGYCLRNWGVYGQTDGVNWYCVDGRGQINTQQQQQKVQIDAVPVAPAPVGPPALFGAGVTLNEAHFGEICKLTYRRHPEAYALQNGNDPLPADRWRCYGRIQ